jgi:hypothetical protein
MSDKLSTKMEYLLRLAPLKWENTCTTTAYRRDTAFALQKRGLIQLRSHLNARSGYIDLQWRRKK